MATRGEIQKKKTALVEDLRAAYAGGAWRQGDVAVSQRELSGRYALSMRTVGLELQKLVDEGILYTVPRVGTFMGRPHQPNPRCFLLALPSDGPEQDHILMLRLGFEDRIATLGGASLSLTPTGLREQRDRGQLPPLAGIFERTSVQGPLTQLRPDIPRVRFGKASDVPPSQSELVQAMDVVDFDNVAGGVQATRHLLQMGYRRVAFVGLHDERTEPFSGHVMHWSAERAAGWAQAMNEVPGTPTDLLFLPRTASAQSHESQNTTAREAAGRVLSVSGIEAIVSVNMFAGLALLRLLEEQGAPNDTWPAIVSFDDYVPAHGQILSCFHLPWWAAGAAAADLLWERSQGTLTGDPQVRTVPMRLVRRLTCRQDWRQPSASPSASALIS